MSRRSASLVALAAVCLLLCAHGRAQAQGAPMPIGPQAQYNPPPSQYGAPPPRQYSAPPASQYGSPPPDQYGSTPPGQYGGPPPRGYEAPEDRDGFSIEEITETGGRFFGRVSMGLARVIEYAFSRAGRPNGYILGEEAGGAFVAGLRYGEGRLYTKDAGEYKVFWQGPSVGWDFGAEGSKTMILVYSLHDINDIYNNFAGVDGSAYFIGGVGLTFMSRDHVTLAPIRSGVGLRLGANIGYLKFTRQPTWNPF